MLDVDESSESHSGDLICSAKHGTVSQIWLKRFVS